MVTSQIFEDFSFCTECEHYDQNDRLCKLFQCVRVNGCQCGVERKPRNNFERVKQMTMEELAVLFNGCEAEGRAYGPKGKSAWLKWLNAEVE